MELKTKLFIENSLNEYMPFSEIYEAKGTIEYPVKDAPKVKGYFGFIGLKYMKRVKNIKKLCVDYINTYVEGSLNVAKNVDKVKLVEDTENLATELGFKMTGLNTRGKEASASTKEGVAFLAGDKAIMDKLASIKNQISVYASKSASLKEWATLMVEKSKEIACQIVFDKAKDMISDKDKVAELEEKFEKALADKDAELEEQKKKTEEISKKMEKYGDFSSMNHDMYTIKDIEEFAKAKYDNDFKLGAFDENSELFKARKDFYLNNKSKWGINNFDDIEKEVGNAMTDAIVSEIIDGINGDDKKEEAKNEIANYLFASYMAKISDLKKNQYLSPVDLKILRVNLPSFVKSKIEGSNKALEDLQYADSPKFTNGYNINGEKLNGIETVGLDKDRLRAIASEWAYTFGEDSLYTKKLNEGVEVKDQKPVYERKRVMSFDEFVAENVKK